MYYVFIYKTYNILYIILVRLTVYDFEIYSEFVINIF